MSDLAKIDELLFGKGKRERLRVNKELVKKLYKYRCALCGKPEKEVGELQMAHYKAHSRGGTTSPYIPLCPTCHRRYDKGVLKKTELKKLNLTPQEYEKMIPKKKKAKKRDILGLGLKL